MTGGAVAAGGKGLAGSQRVEGTVGATMTAGTAVMVLSISWIYQRRRIRMTASADSCIHIDQS